LADIVLLYAPPWFGPTRFSKHHLASYSASRGSRVLYIEAPLTPLGLRRGRSFAAELRETLRPSQAVATRLWVRRHFLPIPYHAATPLTSTRLANHLGQRLLAPMIRRDLQRLNFEKPIVIAGLPHAVDILDRLPRQAVIYHCADDYAHMRGFPPTLPQLEEALCRTADLVVTTSETLCQERKRFNPNTHWVPNGADIDHFSKETAPSADLRDIPHPIVGFVGGLSEWVDLDLVGELARERPHCSFVLVGPVAIDTTPVRGLANVRLLGPRPYAALPSYLVGMDVGLIPFKRNPVTYHADPIKAYEYLAAGLPVVATELPALRRLEHVVRLAETTPAFLSALDAAIGEGRHARRAQRQAEAARHSWTASFETVESLIRDVVCAS
jgi:glycosyltransferase involved in cell wall biosynthesis